MATKSEAPHMASIVRSQPGSHVFVVRDPAPARKPTGHEARQPVLAHRISLLCLVEKLVLFSALVSFISVSCGLQQHALVFAVVAFGRGPSHKGRRSPPHRVMSGT